MVEFEEKLEGQKFLRPFRQLLSLADCHSGQISFDAVASIQKTLYDFGFRDIRGVFCILMREQLHSQTRMEKVAS